MCFQAQSRMVKDQFIRDAEQWDYGGTIMIDKPASTKPCPRKYISARLSRPRGRFGLILFVKWSDIAGFVGLRFAVLTDLGGFVGLP